MAKRKQPSHRPQAKHKKNRRPSQFDKRQRLDQKNPQRKKTTQAKVPLIAPLLAHVSSMAGMLDARMAFRLSIIMAGMMLADDRRVAAAWFAVGGVQDDWDRFYDCLFRVGRRTQWSAQPLVKAVVRKFDPGRNGHLIVAGDDSPTKRYGRHVERLECITIRLLVRPTSSGCMGTIGSRCVCCASIRYRIRPSQYRPSNRCCADQ